MPPKKTENKKAPIKQQTRQLTQKQLDLLQTKPRTKANLEKAKK